MAPRLLLLAALLLMPAGAQSTPPVPALSPPTCQVEARWTGHRSSFGQYLIEIRLPPDCPRDAGRLARIVTRQGGILPPIGYFRLGAGYPRALRYWVLSPAYVKDRFAPNDWRAVPIQRAPWTFFRGMPWTL
ncbi:hypothetical protein [Deinococcus phoenicis]|uniref:hypothetical protein n=1 Tax=Deinococcus phoenicis TaxID=1476583 RepID=UPI0004B43169|nr:hypothetical protein [Deinococcus phoenicis]